MYFVGHSIEGGAEEGMLFEFRIVGKDRFGFLSGDGDEARVFEVTHCDIGKSGLAESEERSRSSEFQIFFREKESVAAFDQCLKTLTLGIFSRKKETIRGFRSATDTPPELMQLGKSESVGVLDNHHSCIGDVDTDFDDGCGDEYMDISVLKLSHYVFFFSRFHFSIEESHGKFGKDFSRKFFVFGFDGFYFGERR